MQGASLDPRTRAAGRHATPQTYNFSFSACAERLRAAIQLSPNRRDVKFQPDQLAGTNVITRHDSGEVWVGTQPHHGSLLVPWMGSVLPWRPPYADALKPEDFEAVLALRPELVIFGSGARIRFIKPALLRCLIDQRIGVETMDTAAACRTYNVLAAEGRSVVAALLSSALPGGGEPGRV